MAASAAYIGVDRRRSRLSDRPRIRPGEVVGFVIVLMLVGVAIPTLLAGLPDFDATEPAQAALRTTWSMLFLCAGLFRLVRWRLTGECSTGLLGSGMFCYGLLSASTASLAPLIHRTTTDPLLSPVTRAVAVTAFLVILARALTSAAVDARVSPIRTIGYALASAALILTGCIIAAAHGHPLSLSGWQWLALGSLQTLCWLSASVVAFRRGLRQASPSYVWIAIGLALLSSAELLHAMAFVGPPALALFTTTLQIVVASLALANSAADLGVVFSAEGNRLLSLSGALRDAEHAITAEEQDQEERLHDARSVIAALKAASLTLDRYDERLDDATKHRLRSSLVSELSRLEHVIDARAQEPASTFRLDVALTPLFIAERRNGLVITSKLGMLSARARPLEFVTVVQNLLVNARRYAPGSIVTVGARSVGENVEVYVEDRGPGVPTGARQLIFVRGHRGGGHAPEGQGLGLYLARRLMRQQGGDIRVEERSGGGARFVLTLPQASGSRQSLNRKVSP